MFVRMMILDRLAWLWVDTSGLPTDNWHHFLRLRDLRQVIAEVPVDGIERVLELGAGDGVQTAALREFFPEVVPIDIAPSGVVDGKTNNWNWSSRPPEFLIREFSTLFSTALFPQPVLG